MSLSTPSPSLAVRVVRRAFVPPFTVATLGRAAAAAAAWGTETDRAILVHGLSTQLRLCASALS